jgi:Zn-dependent peptidase ImmA (M78 family)/DNA-binding XRE family transcriptional regulator
MSSTFACQIGRRLRQLRVEAGLSQASVGRQLGMSRSAVTQVEAGNREVTADELARFASLFQRSPSALLAALGEPIALGTRGDSAAVLADLERILPAASGSELRPGLERLATLCTFMTELEAEVGVDVYGAEVLAHEGASPHTAWEAVHQGFAAADEERRRLDLGSAPIRDVEELLASLRVRLSALPLPDHIDGLFVATRELGAVVVVNEVMSDEERRFQSVHGLAHLIFDRDHGWTACERARRARLSEVRANAFASRFLLPPVGVQRFLHSMGRDTLASTSGGTLDILSDTGARPREEPELKVSGRARRGTWELNRYELAQLSAYFGVTEELAVNGLRNLRHLSAGEREHLEEDGSRSQGLTARRVMRLPRQGGAEGARDAFISRLLALAIEGRRRGVVAVERLRSLVPLLGLEDALARGELLGEAVDA